MKQAESKIRQLREALADESARKEVRLSACAEIALQCCIAQQGPDAEIMPSHRTSILALTHAQMPCGLLPCSVV